MGSTAASGGIAAGSGGESNDDSLLKNRTFDVTWVEKSALMYKEGYAKTFDKETRKASIQIKPSRQFQLSYETWHHQRGQSLTQQRNGRKKRKRRNLQEEMDKQAREKKEKQQKPNKKSNPKKQSAADSIRDNNAATKLQKDHERDLQKLSNLRTLKALQEASCETDSGKIHRMVKILHIAVSDLKEGSLNSSEAEVLDILWALGEMPTFTVSEKEVNEENKAKKEDKKEEKAKSGKDKNSDSK